MIKVQFDISCLFSKFPPGSAKSCQKKFTLSGARNQVTEIYFDGDIHGNPKLEAIIMCLYHDVLLSCCYMPTDVSRVLTSCRGCFLRAREGLQGEFLGEACEAAELRMGYTSCPSADPPRYTW